MRAPFLAAQRVEYVPVVPVTSAVWAKPKPVQVRLTGHVHFTLV